jgi:2-polyprenyl-3-methyl-5-hydroxy-6-metoxy-1,4-benzoquinol methylase
MQPHDVATSYDQIAQRWVAADFNRANGIAQHRRALQFLGRTGTALDVGCGSSGRFLDLLLAEGFDVEGLDLSTEMLRLARQSHPAVRFHQADICTWQAAKHYDLISAWDSIWHVPLSCQEPVLKKLCGSLTAGGVFIWTTGGLDGPSEKQDAAMGPPMYYSVLGIPRTLQVLAESGCVCRHLEYDQFPEKHVFLIAQKT